MGFAVLIHFPVGFDPAIRMPADRIVVGPMHHPAQVVPFEFAREFHAIADPQRLHAPADVHIVRHQHRFPTRQPHQEPLVTAAFDCRPPAISPPARHPSRRRRFAVSQSLPPAPRPCPRIAAAVPAAHSRRNARVSSATAFNKIKIHFFIAPLSMRPIQPPTDNRPPAPPFKRIFRQFHQKTPVHQPKKHKFTQTRLNGTAPSRLLNYGIGPLY